jgi:alcohol dehydrogenase (NADP+)
MSIPERRTIKAYAATKAGLEVEPFEYVSRPLGAEDVEVAISHCSIGGSDLHTMTFGWGHADFPVVPGDEIVGHITAIGPDVKHLQVGDRVGVGALIYSCQQKDTCKECAADMDTHCSKRVYVYDAKYADGEKAYGGYAEFVRVSGHYAFKIPEAIPSAAAAPLLCAGVTAYKGLQSVKPGMHVGVVGIGGLGHLGLQFAKALGGVPVAFSHSPDKEQAARELGAEDFVLCSDPEAVAKAKRSVDVLLVTADAKEQPWDTYLSFVAVGGTMVLVGVPDDKVTFRPHSLIAGNVSFVGNLIAGKKDMVDMLKLAAEKGVRSVVQTLPMSKANEGIAMVAEGKVRFRLVLEN